MIAFSCSHCGLKLKVKPEFAGRSSKCPTCKTPLVVPEPDRTEGHVPQGEIDGTASSLAQAGVAGGVTLGQKSVQELLARPSRKGQRYVIQNEIARGGMGAVLLAIDSDLRREVAVKFMLGDADARKKLRFVEEAQITGQLEHPNIPPIHELGVDAQKRLFFSMKMVRGRSLAQVLEELRTNPRSDEKDWPLGRLLTTFVNICNGLAYAHSRGVVHRDLKPANIMVGDFGEVYVMDWGLAKVLDPSNQDAAGSARGPAASSEASQFADFMGGDASGSATVPAPTSAQRSSKVVTSRAADSDLTQEGSILGTPLYMPPEQAAGHIDQIDARSDIYSLGAILYEVLTLQAPIEKGGGYLAILMRVSDGEIKQPQARAPKRFIPPELSAIAMKALARDRSARYQTVEELRRDIELFQEGRSVSAKEDTKWEMLVKFAKRNKGFSAGMAATFLVLLCSLWFIGKAYLRANEALNKYDHAEKARLEQGRKSVPSVIRAARLLVTEKQFDDAMAQADIALGFDDRDADARLLRAQLLIGEQRYEEARTDLAACLEQRPRDESATKLAALCRDMRQDRRGQLLALADELSRQRLFPLAMRVEAQAAHLQELLVHYRKRIEREWPGLGARLTLDDVGLHLNLADQNEKVKDLTPLTGMRLTSLNLYHCRQVRDVSPLQGMPLKTLGLGANWQVQDLTPLKGMKLSSLHLPARAQNMDLLLLKEMPLHTLNLQWCGPLDLTLLKGLPLTSLSLAGCEWLRDLTPLAGMKLTDLNLHACQVRDLSPLQGMPLTSLYLGGCGQVRDLTPLKGMPLTILYLPPATTDKDLTLLKGMPLTMLELYRCGQVRDLTPLTGMRLTSLNLDGCGQVSDLTPLQGMSLTYLVLRGCLEVRNLTPLKGMPLYALHLDSSGVTDLTPLAGTSLEHIFFTPKSIAKGLDVLRQMKSLKTIGIGHDQAWPAAEFWQRYDKGEFNK